LAAVYVILKNVYFGEILYFEQIFIVDIAVIILVKLAICLLNLIAQPIIILYNTFDDRFFLKIEEKIRFSR
jgi:hypothetical protein